SDLVSANVLTFGAANNHLGWPLVGYNASFWRDGRASATFKALNTGTQVSELRFHYVDTNNYVKATFNGNGSNTFALVKVVAGTPTVVQSQAFTLTINQWYWMEIEAQGTTFIAKLYSTGTTSPGTTKASSTLQ